MRIILVGHFEGQDVTLRGYQFKKGILEVGNNPAEYGPIVAYMGVNYNGWLEGSSELVAARANVAASKAAAKEKELGTGENLDGQAGSVEGGVQADLASTAGNAELGDTASGASSNGEPVVLPGGSGGEAGHNARKPSPFIESDNPQVLKVVDAIRKLNPNVTEHWTATGLPMTSVVQETSGVPNVSRKDIEQAAPGWNKEMALAALNAEASEL